MQNKEFSSAFIAHILYRVKKFTQFIQSDKYRSNSIMRALSRKGERSMLLTSLFLSTINFTQTKCLLTIFALRNRILKVISEKI